MPLNTRDSSGAGTGQRLSYHPSPRWQGQTKL